MDSIVDIIIESGDRRFTGDLAAELTDIPYDSWMTVKHVRWSRRCCDGIIIYRLLISEGSSPLFLRL